MNDGKNSFLLIGLIFSGVGFVTLIVSISLTYFAITSGNDWRNNSAETAGIVTNIDTYRNSNGDRRWLVTVEWIDSGGSIVEADVRYSREPRVGIGNNYKITVNADGMNRIIHPPEYFSLFIWIFPLIFGGIGVGFLVTLIKTTSKRNKILRDGDMVLGFITAIVPHTGTVINGVRPVAATVEAEYRGSVHRFISKAIYPPLLIKEGDTVNVWIDRYDSRTYYVDFR
jgi:hypothetical protein